MADSSQPANTALQSMRGVALCGVLAVALFFGGLGGWAAVAPLQSAAIAPGVLTVESSRKTIQHLEGGIVDEILVRDGDRVEAGQALVRLDDTQARALLEQLRTRQQAALALEARLIAERDGLDEIPFPPMLTAEPSNQKVADAVAGEVAIFEARRRSLDGQTAILEQRVVQYEKEIEGLSGQIASESEQLALIGEEIAGQERLRKRKLIGTQRLIELRRDRAEVAGSRSRHVADIARAEQNIAEVGLKVLELETDRVGAVVEELRETQTLLFDLSDRLRAAADVLARTRIDAPLAGIIVDSQVHTIGGVVGSGTPIMDIVPVGERLIVEARVQPEDIDSVHSGLVAQVALTAFSRRNVPPMEGTVVSVSADRLTDRRSGLPYFLARIALPENPYGEAERLQLYPGMQAEVMIVTGERTALDYLVLPVTRSFHRALREE